MTQVYALEAHFEQYEGRPWPQVARPALDARATVAMISATERMYCWDCGRFTRTGVMPGPFADDHIGVARNSREFPQHLKRRAGQMKSFAAGLGVFETGFPALDVDMVPLQRQNLSQACAGEEQQAYARDRLGRHDSAVKVAEFRAQPLEAPPCGAPRLAVVNGASIRVSASRFG